MANVHYLKRSINEAVIKIYTDNASGATIEVDIADLAIPDETFNAAEAHVSIREIHWGAKAGKQIDLSRKERGGTGVHGHYYFLNAGSHVYVGFVDDVYPERNIQVIFDGPGHVILKLAKKSGYAVNV